MGPNGEGELRVDLKGGETGEEEEEGGGGEEEEGNIRGGLDVIGGDDFDRGEMFFAAEKGGGTDEEEKEGGTEEEEEVVEMGMFLVFLEMPNNRSVPLEALLTLFPTPPVNLSLKIGIFYYFFDSCFVSTVLIDIITVNLFFR